jgi:hypothetical protein
MLREARSNLPVPTVGQTPSGSCSDAPAVAAAGDGAILEANKEDGV